MRSKTPFIVLIRSLTIGGVLVVLVLTSLLNFWSIRSSFSGLLDFGSFVAAGTQAAAGKNPYDVDSPLVYRIPSEKSGRSLASPNLNPPLSVLFFMPLAKMDPITAVSAWRIMSAILFGIGIALLTVFYPAARNPRRILWAIALAGFWQMIALGQIYAPLLLLVIGAWILLEKGFPKLAGLALGAMIAIKPNFVFWLLLLGASGYVTAALTAAIAALGCSLLPALFFGIQVYRQWLAALADYPSLGLLIAGNASFPSLMARLGSAPLGTLLSLLFLGGSLFVAHFSRFSLKRINALGIVGSLLISPFSWVGYTIFTLPIFLSRSEWSWRLKCAAVLLAFPYLVILYFFQKSWISSVLFGWLYGWGLLFIVMEVFLHSDRIVRGDRGCPEENHNDE